MLRLRMGAQMDDQAIAGRWTYEQSRWHCNRKEMFAIIAAIGHFGDQLRERHLVLQSDNRTVISYIRKEGGTRSMALLGLTYHLMSLLDNRNITMTAEYLPGRYNDIADRLSRGKRAAEWHLLRPAMDVIFRHYGVPQIDLFATRQTRVVERYVSKVCRDYSAQFCNAFSRPWQFQLVWVFPPPSLLPRVLHHLNSAQGEYLVVAPMWESVLAARTTPSCTLRAAQDQQLEAGSSGSEHRPSATANSGHEVVRMEDWGWSDITEAWSDAEKALLRSSWRDSTLRTYRPAWSRWVKWCTDNNFDYKRPNGVSLSRFLAYLYLVERLAYPTILLHKSVVLTFGNVEDSENLNSNFFVKHILKAISLENPRPEKPPIWDPSDLVAWLQNNPPRNDNLFEASRRLATLLLLASGRRVHDLTLLRTSASNYIETGDQVILYPAFGSKTDTASYRQSEGLQQLTALCNFEISSETHPVQLCAVVAHEVRVYDALQHAQLVGGSPSPPSPCAALRRSSARGAGV
ncbi:hypothetical protein NE865_12999 [Phthorimaea operculella]|nr:hypothetical protein NE865_12999 [Phthorimaea operculella]